MIRFASSRASRLLLLTAVAVAGQSLNAQVNTSSNSYRAQTREFYAGFTLFTAPTLTVKNLTIAEEGTYDSVMTFDDTDVYSLGFGYNMSDHLNVNGEVGYGAVDYGMSWGPYALRGTADMFNSRFNFDYNFLTTQFTPFITGGIGYLHFDSGIPEGQPEVVCWWDPWWGYICDGYVDTHTASEFTWNAGAGFRWDVNEGFFLKLVYDVTWMEVGAAGTEAFPQYQIQAGWKW